MSIGIWQIAIVVILVVLLFGRGKISSLMGDVAKGIKSFKKGMATEITDEPEPKNVSENNQDTNVSENNQDTNVSENNQDTKDKE
jgi:sec-independent protein translocase protein TatA